MIKTIRTKFIMACMISLTIVLLVIVGGINIVSYMHFIHDADSILELLNDHDGSFPIFHKTKGEDGQTMPPKPKDMSVETPYETRYFTVWLDQEHTLVDLNIDRIAAVDQQQAYDYALAIIDEASTIGFYHSYRYIVDTIDDTIQIIFLDCSRSLSTFKVTLLTSIALSFIGLLAVLGLLILLSRKIVKPFNENYQKQQRFITDAGHELKTPLTIISADMDLIEMENGKNQWTKDIHDQIKRLTGLTNDLIYLAKMDEHQVQLQHIEFPLSDVFEEIIQSFDALAKSHQDTVVATIQPLISFDGDEKAIRQLITLLIDNALKYSPNGSTITIDCAKNGKTIHFSITNPLIEPLDHESLNHFFDRFWRYESSRNTTTGGHGLGLSIAQSIVIAHKGKIKATMDEHGQTITIQVYLPQEK